KKEFGSDTNRFRFTVSPDLCHLPAEGSYPNLAEEVKARFVKCFGTDRPERLKIKLIYPELKKSFVAANQAEATTKQGFSVTRICNGDICSYWVDENFKARVDPIPCEAKGGAECPKKCKPQARLFFRLIDLDYPGMVELSTKSINDIVRIKAVLRSALEIYPEYKLNEITFVLYRYKEKVNTPKYGKQDKWLVGLQVCPSFDRFAEEVREKKRQMLLQGSLDHELLVEDDDYEDPQDLWLEYVNLLNAADDLQIIDQAEQWALSQEALAQQAARIKHEANTARDRIVGASNFEPAPTESAKPKPKQNKPALLDQPIEAWQNQGQEPVGKAAQAALIEVRDKLGITNTQIADCLEELFPGKKSKDLSQIQLDELISMIHCEYDFADEAEPS
ncbi:MAG TPA: hypothetical protein V6C65_19700, partial [Allocoleopsis sp.]